MTQNRMQQRIGSAEISRTEPVVAGSLTVIVADHNG